MQLGGDGSQVPLCCLDDQEDGEDGDDQEDNEDGDGGDEDDEDGENGDDDDDDDDGLGGNGRHHCPFKFIYSIIPCTEFSPTVPLVTILFKSIQCTIIVKGLETQPLGPIACCFK